MAWRCNSTDALHIAGREPGELYERRCLDIARLLASYLRHSLMKTRRTSLKVLLQLVPETVNGSELAIMNTRLLPYSFGCRIAKQAFQPALTSLRRDCLADLDFLYAIRLVDFLL